MCRLFGFRSKVASGVHASLVGAENALMVQSQIHPDGWGVAYYRSGAPHLIKSVSSAIDDSLFRRISGVVSSETVIAHIRRATEGDLSVVNTHPFQYGKWVFAHNGHIRDFPKYRKPLLGLVDEELSRFILGDTDSEVIFFVLLSYLLKHNLLEQGDVTNELIRSVIATAIDDIVDIIGPYRLVDDGDPTQTYLSFLLSNGELVAAHHGGKDLYYSSHKTHCSQRDSCTSLSFSCENPVKKGPVHHLLFSSEPLGGENVWLKMNPGDIVVADKVMNLGLYLKSSKA